MYLYGDFISGRVFALSLVGGTAVVKEIENSDFNISTFGRDLNGEVYLIDYSSGKIYRFTDQ